METSEIKLECLKLIVGESDVTIHIAKADMLYQYCVKDKLPYKAGMSVSELTDKLYRLIKDDLDNGNNTSDSSD